jgi:regulator of PEP synthase PpsR (kinase-PPPase family)
MKSSPQEDKQKNRKTFAGGKSGKGSAGKIPPVYIVSGGSGLSGEQIVETVLAQFPETQVPVIQIPHVRRPQQIENTVALAAGTGGTIVHTLVNKDLREALINLGIKRNVVTIDLMGNLLDRLSKVSGKKPVGQPGLFRQLHQDYFDRIAAIEFTVAHDDGQKPEGLPKADIVLIGVSRSGKTPLSMYLAVHGWKVANVPLIRDVPPPDELSEVDRRRVIGLSIEYEHLMVHRKKRQERIGTGRTSQYTTPAVVFEELEYARNIYRKGGFPVISITNKPIESIADEIIELISRTFGDESRKK